MTAVRVQGFSELQVAAITSRLLQYFQWETRLEIPVGFRQMGYVMAQALNQLKISKKLFDKVATLSAVQDVTFALFKKASERADNESLEVNIEGFDPFFFSIMLAEPLEQLENGFDIGVLTAGDLDLLLNEGNSALAQAGNLTVRDLLISQPEIVLGFSWPYDAKVLALFKEYRDNGSRIPTFDSGKELNLNEIFGGRSSSCGLSGCFN